MQAIIYKNDEGEIICLFPTQEALSLLGINALAMKDVPFGKPFKIIDTSIIPTSPEERAAWSIPDSEFTDGIGADYNAGSNNGVIGWNEDKTPIIALKAQ